jgi:hypothetical protein
MLRNAVTGTKQQFMNIVDPVGGFRSLIKSPSRYRPDVAWDTHELQYFRDVHVSQSSEVGNCGICAPRIRHLKHVCSPVAIKS